MKKEKKLNLAIVVIVSMVIGLAIGIGGTIVKNTKTEKEISLIELGTKISDAKWLAREGMLSEEAIEKFNKSSKNSNYEELDQLLDELLDGKEEEFLQERKELNERIGSILNS